MKPLIIIQARMGSTRFPGKVLAPLCGLPVIRHVIDRCSDTGLPYVVATGDSSENTPLVEYLRSIDVKVHIGCERDVLLRYLTCIEEQCPGGNDYDYFVRVTADCPLVDSTLIRTMADRAVELERVRNRTGVWSHYIGQTNCPDGSDVEVFSRYAVNQAHATTKASYPREHVTGFMKDMDASVCIDAGQFPKFSIDTIEDLKTCEWLIKVCGAGQSWETYVKALEERYDAHVA